MIKELTIEEDTEEIIVSLEPDLYDDILVIGQDVNGTGNINCQARFALNKYIQTGAFSIASATNIFTMMKVERENEGNYYSYRSLNTTTTTTTTVSKNAVKNSDKLNDIRLVCGTNTVITSGSFKFYAKARSEFI